MGLKHSEKFICTQCDHKATYTAEKFIDVWLQMKRATWYVYLQDVKPYVRYYCVQCQAGKKEENKKYFIEKITQVLRKKCR